MTIKKLEVLLNEVNNIKSKGGSTYKEVSNLLNLEATTHNIELLNKLVIKHKGK